MSLKTLETLATDCEIIFFVSSAGRCNIDCRYCIVEPEGRREPSLTFEDLRFLYDHFGRKAFFMFSGKGDFFSGYSHSDRLLDRLLDLDAEIGLDINATVLQELPELPLEKLRKIRHVNVAFHYHELVRFGLLERWIENVHWILQNLSHAWLIVGTVMDPSLAHEWDEAFELYERRVFRDTGHRLQPIRHLNHAFTEGEQACMDEVTLRHAAIVEPVFMNDFGATFKSLFRDVPEVACPAGQRFFRVWNDGRVQGCAFKSELALLGGLKERVIQERAEPFRCSTPTNCDCCLPALLGKMGVPDA